MPMGYRKEIKQVTSLCQGTTTSLKAEGGMGQMPKEVTFALIQ